MHQFMFMIVNVLFLGQATRIILSVCLRLKSFDIVYSLLRIRALYMFLFVKEKSGFKWDGNNSKIKNKIKLYR